jgi:hypothetical protein
MSTSHELRAESKRSYRGALLLLLLTLIGALGPSPASAAGPTSVSGTITVNTNWTLADSPYVVTNAVTVVSGVTLTVEPGVVVKFNGQGQEINVDGTLRAIGTEISPITFTSYQDDSAAGDTNGDGSATTGAPGQWHNISFNSSTSELRYVNIRYGGYGSAPVNLFGADHSVTLDHATISNNQGSAVAVASGAAVTITHSTLSNNASGLYVNYATATVDHATVSSNSSRGISFNLPTFTPLPPATAITNSDITGNGGEGIYIAANGDYPVASMPHGNGNNIFDNNANGTQLSIGGYPGFRRADINWRDNYWGEGVYFWYDDPLCVSNHQTPGHLAYTSSSGNVPAGPISSGVEYVQPDLWTVRWCGWDQVKIDPCQFSSTYIAGDLREIDFAQPKNVGEALDCAQQAGLTPVQLESDYSSVCSDLRTGYVIGAGETSAEIVANYAPATQSLFTEFNSFQDISCAYPDTAPIATIRALASSAGSDGIPITPFTCQLPTTPWWPASGRIETGPSWLEPYASQQLRYIYQTFTWTQDRLDNITNCDEATHNWTYEPDATFDNYDGLHYFGRKMNWASNLPRKYNDTRWEDSDNEPTYSVGTADAFALQAGKKYFTLMRTAPGNASSDRGKLVGQIGRREIGRCYKTWCIDSRDSKFLVDAWYVPVPGTKTWTK